MPIRLLLADPDAVLRASLVEQLEREGAYQITAIGNAPEALAAARGTAFAVAIVDEKLGSGGLAAALRGEGMVCPILLLAGSEDTPLAAADDSIVKPFRFSALLQRLHGLVSQRADDEGVRIGPYLFHPSAKLLEQNGRKI